jgi:hypothetical protein
MRLGKVHARQQNVKVRRVRPCPAALVLDPLPPLKEDRLRSPSHLSDDLTEGEFSNVTRSDAGKGVARYQW